VTEQGSLDTPILVFGTTITALGVVRAFARRGQTVWTHTLPGDVVTLSKYYKPLPLPPGFDPEAPATERLESILRSLPIAKAFLLPCSDLWTEAAAALPEDLRLRFPACIAPHQAILILVDKGKLAETMAELGLPHPRSFAVDREDDLAALEDRVFENAFLKPKSSPLFIEKYGVKGMRVHSRAEAAARLRDVKDAGFEVILQEYIPGPPSEHYFIDGFIDRNGVVRARFARQRLRMYPTDFGNSTYMVSVAMDQVGPARESLDILLSTLKYRGIFSAEFKRDPRDGKFYLVEVNPRPWWYVGFAESCGVHVCAMAYADALGLPPPEPEPYPIGKACVYPYIDMHEYLWHRRHHRDQPHAPLVVCAGAWLVAHKPIFAWDDPCPAVSSWLAGTRQFLKKRLWPQVS